LLHAGAAKNPRTQETSETREGGRKTREKKTTTRVLKCGQRPNSVTEEREEKREPTPLKKLGPTRKPKENAFFGRADKKTSLEGKKRLPAAKPGERP